jgi:hypothetical protein
MGLSLAAGKFLRVPLLGPLLSQVRLHLTPCGTPRTLVFVEERSR